MSWSVYDMWKTAEPDDWGDGPGDELLDDEYGPEGPEEEQPLFGCACENPSIVDDCCPACIEWFKEQERDDSARDRFVESLRAPTLPRKKEET